MMVAISKDLGKVRNAIPSLGKRLWPEKFFQSYHTTEKFFQCVCAGCLHCVKVCVVIDKVPVSSKSDHHHYMPMGWSDWTLVVLRITIEEVELLIAFEFLGDE